MRGTPYRHRRNAQCIRIIPAYAGNTHGRTVRSTNCRDHPRVCGEHSPYLGMYSCWKGSSPRMRGTRSMVTMVVRTIGIIPAYAGNTRTHLATVTGSRDHPRVCGEHISAIQARLASRGSSPRMRGTPRLGAPAHPRRGIIPAYAGNTLRPSGQQTDRRDHPRVCGEHVVV